MLKYAAQGDRWANDGNLSKLVTRIALKRLAHFSLYGMLGNRTAGIRRALKDTNRREACGWAGCEQFPSGGPLQDTGRLPHLPWVFAGSRVKKQGHTHPALSVLSDTRAHVS